ncbi:MAG: DUF3179 domain-containing protein [Chloroflexi bacterium]|nr:DUF3179 domain-containing protein [Chloroflexota bacterium]
MNSTTEKPEPTYGVSATNESPQPVPDVDLTIHSVPLDQILFDTFGTVSARFVPLSEISDVLKNELRDAIAPVVHPVYGASDALPWLGDDDLVLGYQSDDQTFAYPINVLNFHEIVNDTIGGVPVLITYCPLCFSGVVFSRELDGQTLTFGNTSALYQSDLVMYDHQTGSYWFQVAGEAVVGTMTGSRLQPLASTTMPWGRWKGLHPDTLLITGSLGGQETMFTSGRYGSGFGNGYQERINNEQFAFPVDAEKLDGRLSAGEIVLTVEIGESAKAFPLGVIGDDAVNSEVGSEPIVVFTASKGRSVGAFSRTVNGAILTFSRQDDDLFTDDETGSAWDFAGRAVDGPLAGVQLGRVSSRRAFWFSVAISFPDIEIHNP